MYVVAVVDVNVATILEGQFRRKLLLLDLVSSRIPDTIGVSAAAVVDQDAFVGHGLELSTPLRLVDLAECLVTE